MPYNPSVNDRSGEILAAAQNNASQMTYEGMVNLGQGIGDGLQSASRAVATMVTGVPIPKGEGIAGAIAKSQENTAKLQGVQATGSAMQAILPQYGKEGMALGQALQAELGKAGNNPDKMAGAMMAFMPAMENLQSRFNQNAQYTQALQLARQKAALGGGGGGSNPALSVEVADDIDIWQNTNPVK